MAELRIFLTYSWETAEHNEWVRKLADSLEEIEGVHVTWDGYDLDSLSDKNSFMESGIYEADFVLIVATARYKEKADQRVGGVGIETFLASAAHWDELLKTKKTRLITLLREHNSTPRYLTGHFYIDFIDDSLFNQSLARLLDIMRGNYKIPRPRKRSTLSQAENGYSFSKVEEIIRVNYPNRRALVYGDDGTDFSVGNRIKYEIWETRSPALSYFFALLPNINISQTAQHAARKLKAAHLKLSEMTVLRQRSARPEQDLIAQILHENGLSIKLHECTYKEYIWDYCIDEALKGIAPPEIIANYTPQELAFVDNAGTEVRTESAHDYLVNALEQSNTVAHLVIAPGGMGKTSLSLSVAAKLHNRNDLRSSVVLIQSEAIRKHLGDRGLLTGRIESIYDIYELYAKYQGHSKIFERATFDLAVVCGNLTIIIDGLDELSSMLQEKFDVDRFLESLKSLHSQLGSSKVLLTTRDSIVIDDEKLSQLGIASYELLGFNPDNSRKYMRKRFLKYDSCDALVQKVMSQIERIKLIDSDARVVPFFADIVATVVEDELERSDTKDFELTDDHTPYPSNNDLTDHIIHSVLRREKTRHEPNMEEADASAFISELVSDYGKRIPAIEIQNRLEMLYDARGADIYSKISLNPLLQKNGDYFDLRYSFLASYFEVLFILRGIVNSSIESCFVKCLARLAQDSQEFKEVRRYFANNKKQLEESIASLIPKLKVKALSADTSNASLIERENHRRGIASLLSIYANVAQASTGTFSADILRFYGVNRHLTDSRTVEGLFFIGDFPSFDFSNLTVINSVFRNYKRFLQGRFANTKFMYTNFDHCAGGGAASGSITLDPSMIDESCDPGDLKEEFATWRANKESESALLVAEVKKFLHCFYKGSRFVDNSKRHLHFSNRISGLASNKFDRHIAAGYITVKVEKAVDTFYEIASDFQPSVRKYLTDGYPDGKVKKFLAFVRGL